MMFSCSCHHHPHAHTHTHTGAREKTWKCRGRHMPLFGERAIKRGETKFIFQRADCVRGDHHRRRRRRPEEKSISAHARVWRNFSLERVGGAARRQEANGTPRIHRARGALNHTATCVCTPLSEEPCRVKRAGCRCSSFSFLHGPLLLPSRSSRARRCPVRRRPTPRSPPKRTCRDTRSTISRWSRPSVNELFFCLYIPSKRREGILWIFFSLKLTWIVLLYFSHG